MTMIRVVTVILAVPLFGALGDDRPHQGVETQDWHLVYEYSETPPNPGAGAPSTRLHFECDDSGRYSLTQTVHAVSGALTSTTNGAGNLSNAMMTNLQQRLKTVDFPTLTSRQFALPGGSGEEDGWGGRIRYITGGKTSELTFTSRGGWPTDKAKQQEVQRLMDFIQSMNGLLLPQIGRSAQAGRGE